MASKVIILFALLAVAFAERPYLGFRMRFPITSQIVGGSDAPKDACPFITSLQWGPSKNTASHFCAGSILNSEWIITAAHCLQAVPNYGMFLVKAGKYMVNDVESSEQVGEVSKIIIHEQYQGGVGPYDMGLIKLKTPLKFSKEVQAIELAEPGEEPTGDAVLYGWGITDSGMLPNKLQYALLKYVDRNTCYEAVKRLTGSSPVHETNVCTGPLTGGISACNGDSGGPLTSRNGNSMDGKLVLTGIVSWGIVPCGTKGAPSVYTGVSNYNSWISKNIADN